MGEAEQPTSLEPNMIGPVAITGPSLQQYVKAQQPEATVVAAGKMSFDGHAVSCGTRPTVLNPKLDSWGGAFPGYLIINPDRVNGLSTPVKFYIYHHECGHQFIGASETGADCFSIRRGVRWGWLDDKGMDNICKFISQLKGDSVHPPGPKRCELMRQCYAEALGSKRQASNQR